MISVIVCTYNRAESLRQTLDAISKIDMPMSGMEVLVVDNNSRDQTPEVVQAAAAGALFPIRRVFEPNQGLSHARNRGIAEARGQYLVFIDDDITPEKRWLNALREGFVLFEADALSGPIKSMWNFEPPRWYRNPDIRKSLSGVLGELDLGPRPLIADTLDHGFMFGGNMAFRKSFFQDIGLFRTDLGVVGRKRRLGEDTDLLERGFRSGKKFVYVPAALVGHRVQQEKLTISAIRRWKYQKGLSTVSKASTGLPPLWLLKECFANAAASLAYRLLGRSSRAFIKELSFWIQAGQIRGHFQKIHSDGEMSGV